MEKSTLPRGPWDLAVAGLAAIVRTEPAELEAFLAHAFSLARDAADTMHPDSSLCEFPDIEFTVETEALGGHWLLLCEQPAVDQLALDSSEYLPADESMPGLALLRRRGQSWAIALEFLSLGDEMLEHVAGADVPTRWARAYVAGEEYDDGADAPADFS